MIRLFSPLRLLTGFLAIACAHAQPRTLEFYTFDVLAGQAGTLGGVDGTGAEARFSYPKGLDRDAEGNLYLAAGDNQTIRKITPGGVVTTVAGSRNNSGSTDGPASSARFRFPGGVTVAVDGTLYVTDGNNTVRKVATDGVVSTLAGRTGFSGSTDGSGSNALFDDPTDLAVDASGNVYVADFSNHTIRKVTPAGVVTTLAGLAGATGSTDGTGAAARFFDPRGICVDAAGNVYVADRWNHLVRKITPQGVVTTVAGRARSSGNVDGVGGEARLTSPQDLAIDGAGNLYVLEWTGSVVRRISPDGMVSTLAGKWNQLGFANGTGTEATFRWPISIAVTPQGTVYLSDENHTIRRGVPNPASALTISSQPAAVAATTGGVISLSVVASGSGALTYQWRKDGTNITGATGATFTLTNAQATNAGNYTVVVRSALGAIASAGAAVTVGATVVAAPAITAQPAAVTALAGGEAVFSVTSSGSPAPTFQWRKGGAAIAGATQSTLRLTSVTAASAGTYTVVITSSAGTVTSQAATLVVTTPNPGRLINLSILTSIANEGDSFTMGYVVGGANTTGAKPLVVRAVGPSLGALGVGGTLDDPKIELFAGATKTGDNDNWGGTTALSNAMAGVGAFAYAGATSRDAAAAFSATAGDNSVKVSAAGTGTGTVIAEVYDASPADTVTTATPRLVNVSVLKHIGSSLTAGFVIGGASAKTVLIRAIGPGLAAFGLAGTVADPRLELFNGQSASIGTNDNWGGTAALSAAFTAVGAFALEAASRDAALLATLPPGNYTVRVSGVDGTTGVAIVEVYEVP
jgi:sugar lactone lactonase YvrE